MSKLHSQTKKTVFDIRIRRVVRLASFTLLGLYAVYVGSSVVFLNTPLFAKVTVMENVDLTHVRFHGAISWFPGRLWIQRAQVNISDHNVDIPIDLNNISARFRILPLFHKRIEVPFLLVKDTKLRIGMKSVSQSAQYIKKYTKSKDMDLKVLQASVAQNKRNKVTLDFAQIQIERISRVDTPWGAFLGNLRLRGGFRLQPKVEVEVYPTHLQFISGEMSSQFMRVEGDSTVRFHPFRIVDAPGNAVWPYADIELRLSAQLKSLSVLHLALRQLKGYSFKNDDGAEAKISVSVKRGRIQKESFVHVEPSQIVVRAPTLTASARGGLEWKVDQKNASILLSRLESVSLRELKRERPFAHIGVASVRFRILGTHLTSAFHGLVMSLDLRKIKGRIQRPVHSGTGVQYSSVLSGEGTLHGHAGLVPVAVQSQVQKKHSFLNLKIAQLEFVSRVLPRVTGSGEISLEGQSIKLAQQLLQFPRAHGRIRFQIGDHGETESRIDIENIEHQLDQSQTWKGRVRLEVDDTGPIMKALKEQKDLSSLAASLASVETLVANVDVETRNNFTWVRVNDLSADGPWSVFGTLVNAQQQWNGDFEAQLLGVPVGIRVRESETDIKFLPTAQWYKKGHRSLR